MGFFDKELDTEHGADTYEYSYTCDNCGTDNDIEIPTGQIAKNFLERHHCHYCGCAVLQPIENIIQEKGDDE